MHRFAVLVLSVSVSLVGCAVQDAGSVAQTARGLGSVQKDVASDATIPSATRADDVAAFVPANTTVLDTVHGDLTGDGVHDTLLVLTPDQAGPAALGEGPARTVMLLVRDAAGSLRKAAENSRLIPCARCGGLAGDPYAYARIDAGAVTVSVSGGSRERWFDDYVFRFTPQTNSWRLERVLRGVTDTATGMQKRVELSEADFGDVDFAEFDPETLPAIALMD